jgi:hypothetical protein
MKVSELIEELKTFPGDYRVLIDIKDIIAEADFVYMSHEDKTVTLEP